MMLNLFFVNIDLQNKIKSKSGKVTNKIALVISLSKYPIERMPNVAMYPSVSKGLIDFTLKAL